MDAEFVEKYDKLSDMKAGQSAVSKDREKFFVCGYVYDTLKKQNVATILEVNNLRDQYSENRDMTQPVKILKSGDKFVCKA